MIIQKKKEHSVKQKFKKLDELLKKKKDEKILLSKSIGKNGVGKKGDAEVHSVAVVADKPTNHKRDGDTIYNLVSSFHFLYEFTVNLNFHYV